MRTKKILKSTRVIVLIIFIVLALVSINPKPWATGATIRTIKDNSSSQLAGMSSSSPNARPMSREKIVMMNNVPIKTAQDYYDFVEDIEANRNYFVKTDKGEYTVKTQPILKITVLDETEEKIVSELIEEVIEINGTNTTINTTINKTILVNKTLEEIIGVKDLGITVYNAPVTNLKKGLELQGGTRVLLEPEVKLDGNDMGILMDNMKRRLNVFGLTDIVVRQVNEMPEPLGSGKQYILVEIAGANEEEVKELLSKQGKFESKIGNFSVFKGGNDVKYVCRSAECAGIDPSSGCGNNGNGWYCNFRFSISLSLEAAKNMAEGTKDLAIIPEGGKSYLEQPISLYLDDALVDELQISADLKGREVTDIAISGSGSGANQQEAVENTLNNMKKLQTVLITGSLPVKLTIAKTDNISPTLGAEFINSALIIGAIAILAVGLIIFLRYKKIAIITPTILTLIAEVVILLGFASLVGWNLDIAAIAGIIIVVGTGVDHLVIITDETLKGETDRFINWKETLKKALFIITAAYMTTVVAMIPLWYAGAGMLKGFAITTIAGVTFGVFIARPAYAAIIEVLLKH